MSKTYKGKLVTEVRYLPPRDNKKACAFFTVKHNSKIIDCIAFDDVADQARGTVKDSKVTVSGYYKGGREEASFNVQVFDTAQQGWSFKDYVTQLYGSYDDFLKERTKQDKIKREQGLVRITYPIGDRKDICAVRWVPEHTAWMYEDGPQFDHSETVPADDPKPPKPKDPFEGL